MKATAHTKNTVQCLLFIGKLSRNVPSWRDAVSELLLGVPEDRDRSACTVGISAVYPRFIFSLLKFLFEKIKTRNSCFALARLARTNEAFQEFLSGYALSKVMCHVVKDERALLRRKG